MNIRDYKQMGNKELLHYMEGLEFTNKHLKELFVKRPDDFKNVGTVDWMVAFRKRNELLQEVRNEIIRRMSRPTDTRDPTKS